MGADDQPVWWWQAWTEEGQASAVSGRGEAAAGADWYTGGRIDKEYRKPCMSRFGGIDA